jgi:hypothetical protein
MRAKESHAEQKFHAAFEKFLQLVNVFQRSKQRLNINISLEQERIKILKPICTCTDII